MGQYTFRIDNKDPLYKKLIKLPTTYYRLEHRNNKYTIHSHNNGTVEIGDNTNDVKLRWENKKIVLYKGNSALKLNGENFVIEQEAIVGESRNDTIDKLISVGTMNISLKKITDSPDSGIGLSFPRSRKIIGALKSINFYDENDPVLSKIKEEKGGLYFTIKDSDTDCSRTVYMSDKDGNHLTEYDDYQYQYKPNVAELGTIDSLIKANDAKQKFTLQKGKELSDGVYEANIVSNDKPIATLPKIGYYMFNDQLVMRNHVTEEEVVIPRDFHFLKVVKFGNDDYKLTFCNVLGNEFFEYKKYDPQYSNVSDEYKFVSLNCAKKEYSPDLRGLFSHRPSFFITEESTEPGSQDHYLVAVFELINGKKGRKMATLINEFGYFDQDNKFHYCDYHTEAKHGVYDPFSIEKKCTITEANSEFYLAGNNDIILHAIPESSELF